MTQGLASKPNAAERNSHLSYLDGIRGLAALYVVLTHIAGLMQSRPDGGGSIGHLLIHPIFGWGTYAVCIFIVLSGYCLMLPVARSESGELRGGFREYIRRRSRRILPPYYAALALSLLEIGLTRHFYGAGTKLAVETSVSLKTILTHVLLIHNLFRHDLLAINGPLWSVAMEWQIYFIFPLLLLPTWRRFGTPASVAVGLAVGVTPHFLFHEQFDGTLPQLIALFALGMAAAAINFSARAQERHWRDAAPWGMFTLAGVALVVLISTRGITWVIPQFLWVCPIVGAATACLLVYCTDRGLKAQATPPARTPLILRVLDSRAAVTLGTFSYSLYLIHWPLLVLAWMPLITHHASVLVSFLGLLAALPVIILLAYVFHRIFERPFMSRPSPNTERQAEVAAIVNPAP